MRARDRCRRRGLMSACLFFVSCLPAVAATADPPAPRGTRYTAKVLRDFLLDGEKVTSLSGDVRIVRDSLEVLCDSALFYQDAGQYDFFGDVRMVRNTTVLTCQSSFYNEVTGDAEFHRNVRVLDGETVATSSRGEMENDGERLLLIRDARLVTPQYVVWADTIVRHGETEEGEAFGAVRIIDPEAESLVTGGHAVFSSDGGTAVVDRGPEMTSREQGRDPLIATAREMHFQRDESIVVMVDSVRIRQGRSTAFADSATIYGREHVVLRGSPSLDDGVSSVMTSEQIEFFYAMNELDRIKLSGGARIIDTAPEALSEIYAGLPPANELSGDTITLDMEDGQPGRALVLGDSRSIYVPQDSPDEVAFNDVSGDTIVIDFIERRIDQVDVLGNTSGTYSFMRLDTPEAEADSLVVADATTDGPPDTSSTAAAPADTLAAAVGEPGLRMVDFMSKRETVDYSGRVGIFQLGKRMIAIRGEARMIYGTMDLSARDIRLDNTARELYATGDPLLVDKDTKLAGRELAYGFEHKTGAVKDGVTAMDDYYYVGKHIKRFDEGDMKIRSGKMTSCDLDKPHYHFWADRMKIKMGDKMVAMPIVLKIGEVPVFALPFYFKSMESGRKSGILFPTFNFGWSERTGRYIRDWGYYWATNDYTDFTFRGDFNERREFTWRINNQYRKRYAFDGNASYSRRTTLGSGPKTREWQLQWSHNQQTLFDYYKLRASIKMSSQSISRSDLLSDVGVDVINSQQTSTVFLSRSWSAVNTSLNLKRDEYVNAEDDDLLTDKLLVRQSFPQLTVSFRSQPLMSALSGGRKGNLLGEILRNTYFRHSYNVSRVRQTKELSVNTLDTGKGSFSLDIKPPRLSIFSVSTGVSSGHTWTRNINDGTVYAFDETDSTYTSDPVYDEVQDTRTSLSINSSLSTTLYGLFNARLGRLRGLRHTLRFSASHRLSPSIVGKQTRNESFSFSMGNRFDMKYAAAGADADSAETLKKLDGLLDWSASTSYDPDKPVGSRWSTISNNFSIKPGSNRNLKLTLSNTIDPKHLRVTNTRIVYGLNISSRFNTGGHTVRQEAVRNSAIDLLGAEADSSDVERVDDPNTPGYDESLDSEDVSDEGRYDDEFAGFGYFSDGSSSGSRGRDETGGGLYIPWRFGSNFSYSKNHLSDAVTARVNMNVSATLSRGWKVSFRTGYDLETGTMSHQSWNLERDLHCWIMKFSRTVSSVDSQYGFIISLKALPDVKVTRGKEDMVGGLGRLGGGVF